MRLTSIAAVGWAVAALVAVQSGTPAPAQQPQPVVRVTAQLVQVTVHVTDRSGRPVRDLKREDFVLLDEGQAQAVEFFLPPAMAAAAPLAEPLPEGTFSNRVAARTAKTAGVTIILFDALNTAAQDQSRAAEELRALLTRLRPDDRVALYTLGNGLRILHDFTGEVLALQRAFQAYSGETAARRPAEARQIDSGMTALNVLLDDTAQREKESSAEYRIGMSFSALEWIAARVAGIPGRKNLIWLSGGFPFALGLDFDEEAFAEMDRLEQMNLDDAKPRPRITPQSITRVRRDVGKEIERLGRLLNHSNLAIYPVDVRGLVAPRMPDSGQEIGRSPGVAPDPTFHDLRLTHLAMHEVAVATGGQAFLNSNALQKSIERVLDQPAESYTLGFAPSHNEWNNKFRRLTVRVTRPGLRVTYRRGYVATPAEPVGRTGRTAALSAASLSPLDATGIGITVQIEKGTANDAPALIVEVQIDARNLVLTQREGKFVGAVAVQYVQRSATGAQLHRAEQTVNLNLKPEAYQTILNNGLAFTKELPVAASAHLLRIVVRDETSTAIGSLSVPLN